MVTRKYVRDYRLEDELGPKGRLRTRAVYVGGDYVFQAPERATPRARAAAAALNLFGWICLLGALALRGRAAHIAWVIVPMAACVLPLAYESMAVWTLLRVRPPFRRDQADKLADRLPISALAALVLSGASLFAMCLMHLLARTGFGPADAAYLLLAACLAAASALSLRLAGRFKTAKAGNQDVIMRENA
ncbi:MAG: hypothetical protein Q4C13_02020 [Clostridia bacterium]|nr:hypothetical protein [Clostridia bacterium]